MLLRETRINLLLLEYNFQQRKHLILYLNKLLVLIMNSPKRIQLESELNKILEFYRYNKTTDKLEEKDIYQEFKTAIYSFAKRYNLKVDIYL